MPPSSPYQRFGVPELINCVGHATRLGGSSPAPEVVEAMTAASRAFIEIDDLQAAASRVTAECTAALAYVWRAGAVEVELPALVELAHRHDLPVIVDAAIALPPAENLSGLIAQGADLVAYSGGKHLGGPQASGFLCGRAHLVRSAWAQMVDMDVRPGTWSLQSWVESGWIARPPRHGIGRSMKVGKEAVIGLLTALERYPHRDHAAERATWLRLTSAIGDGLAGLEGRSE